MKWITRERPKIDRIACPWLIKRFVDQQAEFLYVPFEEVIPRSKKLDAIPFDLPEVEYKDLSNCLNKKHFLSLSSNDPHYGK